jgi:putative transposase
MPDHLHAIISPMEATLERAMQLIKGGYSYRLRKELGIEREAWQPGLLRSSPQRSFRLSDSPHLSRKQPGQTRTLPDAASVPIFLRLRQIRTRPSTSVAKAERLAMLLRHG